MSLTVLLLGMTSWLAWVRGYSPIEMFPSRVEAALVGVLRSRFPRTVV